MGPAWVRPLIMIIFGAVSSWDARCGAYRATGTELGWMPGEAQGLCGQQARESEMAECFRLTSYPNALVFG